MYYRDTFTNGFPLSMRALRRYLSVLVLAVGLSMTPTSLWAQEEAPVSVQSTEATLDAETTSPLPLTVEAAVKTALEQNLDLQSVDLDVRNADQQIREAWGQLYPSLDLSSGYTRNVVTANPFAGSDVTGIFGGGSESDWVAFNERRRLAGEAPITYGEFQRRQRESLEAAGISLGTSDNPFGVDNEFNAGLQLSQTLYSKQAFSAVKGAQQLKDVNRYARDREVQVVTNEVVTAFYQSLLARERVRVLEQRVQRTESTLQEVTTQVERGVVPKAQRLGSQVELSNARTELIDARNAADLARDNLKRTIGLPPERPIELEGSLEHERDDGLQHISTETIEMASAVEQAVENRPDLERARLNAELREVQTEQSRAEFFPRVEAIANFNYSGRVPDDRSRIDTRDPNDPTNPFYYNEVHRDFFHDDFWNPSLNVGLQLTWNIFNGFQSSSRVQQAEIQRRQAELQRDQLRKAVKVEVRSALRDLETARERIEAQETNVRRAQLNYDHVSARVSEGTSSQLELREASDQLDQSRLNYLQAVHDYVVARSDLETALGQPLTSASASYLLTRR